MTRSIFLTILTLFVASFALAQENGDTLDLEGVLVSGINALIPVLGTIIIFFVKKVWVKVPRVALPAIAMGLGVLLDWLLSFISGGTFTPVAGAILGACSVWLREIIDTAQKHGLAPINGGGL